MGAGGDGPTALCGGHGNPLDHSAALAPPGATCVPRRERGRLSRLDTYRGPSGLARAVSDHPRAGLVDGRPRLDSASSGALAIALAAVFVFDDEQLRLTTLYRRSLPGRGCRPSGSCPPTARGRASSTAQFTWRSNVSKRRARRPRTSAPASLESCTTSFRTASASWSCRPVPQRRYSTSDPDQARNSLRSIQETGRQARHELRRLLGLMRAGREEAVLAPQPGLAQLPSSRGAATAGRVGRRSRREGRAEDALAGTAARGISNHPGSPDERAETRRARQRSGLECVTDSEAIEVEVVDDGSHDRETSGGQGFGLIGME